MHLVALLNHSRMQAHKNFFVPTEWECIWLHFLNHSHTHTPPPAHAHHTRAHPAHKKIKETPCSIFNGKRKKGKSISLPSLPRHSLLFLFVPVSPCHCNSSNCCLCKWKEDEKKEGILWWRYTRVVPARAYKLIIVVHLQNSYHTELTSSLVIYWAKTHEPELGPTY